MILLGQFPLFFELKIITDVMQNFTPTTVTC